MFQEEKDVEKNEIVVEAKINEENINEEIVQEEVEVNEEEVINDEEDNQEEIEENENKKKIDWKKVGKCCFWLLLIGLEIYDKYTTNKKISALESEIEIKNNIINSNYNEIYNLKSEIASHDSALSDGLRKKSSECAKIMAKKRYK